MVVALRLLAARKVESWRQDLLQKPTINMLALDEAMWAEARGSVWLDMVCF